MALIIYFTRVPRYQNIFTNEYETIPFNDVQLINKYFNWKKAREEHGVDCYSLKDWCGVSEDDMPHKTIVNYYGDFYNKKMAYNNYDSEMVETESIFEDLARIVKANQIFNWLINNVTNGNVDNEHHEVSKEKLKMLCRALKQIRRDATFDDNGFKVDEDVAKEYMPIMDDVPMFWGTNKYDEVYAEQVVKVYDIIRDILNTTDFEKESIYFNAIW